MSDLQLKEKAIRGGLAKMCSQAATFLLRIGSLMILGRLLDPRDFGLVGMVTAVIGVLNLFKDFGLSTATVQRASITEEQLSTLFWINILVGAILGFLSLASAPAVVAFYHEPRLLAVTAVLAASFLFNAAGVQHAALLQRQMRFVALAVVDFLSLFVGVAVAVTMALRGYGYWAIVGMTIVPPLVSSICVWVATAWVPGMPRRGIGLRSMMRFGGTITLNGIVVYIAYNLEKVLLGRFWGADAIGIYGRAYQILNIPTDNLNSSVGGVAFSALSRLQDDPGRLRSCFLKCYSMLLALSIPITIACAVFADDIIFVVLGPKWKEAVPIFRLLVPTILAFAMINPFGWLLFSIGMVGRSLKIAFAITPLVIVGYLIGLPHGPKGVALAYSVAMTLWIIPHIVWCIQGTGISFTDIMATVSRPLVSGIVAGVLALGVQISYGHLAPPLLRLVLGTAILLGAYVGMLFYAMGQKAMYLDLLRGLRKRPVIEDTPALASVADV